MTKQELQVSIGEKLREARVEQNLTIEDVADRVGISTTFYSNLECGNKMMSLPILHRLIEVLDVSADWLLMDRKPNIKIKNIETLLCGQSPEMVAFLEKMIRLSINYLSSEREM